MSTPLIEALVEAFTRLPGVGRKTAQRMALHLLRYDRAGGRRLAETLARAMDEVGQCARCRTFSEQELCDLCANPRRDPGLLCVVETPADIAALEQSGAYQGQYFVLMGHLSPIDGIGPEELGLDLLERRLDEGGLREVILATNPTLEGETTAHYIAELCRARGIPATRIAHGVPAGGELEHLDPATLLRALAGRRAVEEE